MLIEFSVKNYCSIRDKQTLSMVASNKDKSLLGNLIEVDTPGMGKTKLLTSAVVYGANASGKSNLFAAARFMRLFVTDCVTKLKPGDKTGVRPFRLDPESEKSPSEFEVMFLHEGVRYQYGFALDETRVHEEWLFAYPKGKSQRWFQRTFNPETEEYDWAFSTRHLKGDKESLKGMTRDNALFLSVGAQFNHEQLGSVSIWFPERLIVLDYAAPRMVSLATQLTIGQNEKFGRSLSSIADLLKNADTGIEELKAERDDNGEWKLQFLHKVADSRETVAFEEWEESTGTRKFLSLLGPWFGLLRFGSTQFIDEIDASMHPLLVRELLRPIHDPDSNTKGSQLLLTTHDPTLLDSGLFRRDQVWFLEKDRDGATDLYPLSDYKTRGKVALQKGYLVGRYGAIPFMGVLSFDQETAEEVDQATAETDQTPVRRETAAQSSSGCVRW